VCSGGLLVAATIAPVSESPSGAGSAIMAASELPRRNHQMNQPQQKLSGAALAPVAAAAAGLALLASGGWYGACAQGNSPG
jgi:hypothetical protein